MKLDSVNLGDVLFLNHWFIIILVDVPWTRVPWMSGPLLSIILLFSVGNWNILCMICHDLAFSLSLNSKLSSMCRNAVYLWAGGEGWGFDLYNRSLLIVMRLTRGGRQRSDCAHCVVNKGWNMATAVTRQSSNTFMQQPSGNTCTWVYNVCQKLSLSGRMLEGQKIFNLSLLIFCLCVLE